MKLSFGQYNVFPHQVFGDPFGIGQNSETWIDYRGGRYDRPVGDVHAGIIKNFAMFINYAVLDLVGHTARAHLMTGREERQILLPTFSVQVMERDCFTACLIKNVCQNLIIMLVMGFQFFIDIQG